MRSIQRLVLLLFLPGLLTTCEKDELVTGRDYPRIKTLPVTDITREGARFNAELIYRGAFAVLHYGFVWGEYTLPTITGNDRVVYAENTPSDQFNYDVTTTLKEGATYFVRAFVETADYTVYGESVEFLSLGSRAPSIRAIAPVAGTIGDTVVLRGEKFSYLNATNKVFFNDEEARVIASADTLVVAVVPKVSQASLQVSLSILGNRSVFDGVFTVTAPVIADFSPKTLAVDDTLTITGANFSYATESNQVKIGGVPSRVVSASKRSIKAIIPPGLRSDNTLEVTIAGQTGFAANPVKFLEPVITGLSATAATFGEEVTIIGRHFSAVLENNSVKVGAATAELVSASKEALSFLVPAALSTARNRLTYTVAGRELAYEYLDIKPPVIKALDVSTVTRFDQRHLVITGEHFNPIPEKNAVLLGGKSAPVLAATNDRLTVEFPRELIPEQRISVLDTLDVQVRVLDQQAVLTGGLTIDYRSVWTRMRDFPGSPRIFGASFSIGNKGYIGLGGGDEFDNWYSDFWEYDPVWDAWKRLSDFPGATRSKFAWFVIDDKAYIIAGSKGNPYEEANNVREVWAFDGSTRTWTRKRDFPGGPRWRPYGFSLNGFGYVGGGVYANYEVRTDLWKYDPDGDRWEQLNEMESGMWREDIFAIADDQSGYILTDYCGHPCNQRYFWKYDEQNGIWQSITNMPGPYRETTGFPLNGKLYVGTGVFSLWTGTSEFFEYDPGADAWRAIPFVEDRRTASSFSIGNYGYLLLGKSGCHCANKNDVWRFDPTKAP